MEKGGGSGDNNNADEGQERSELLLPGEGFARDKPGADVAGENGGEESEDGCFCEWHVEKGEIQAEDAEESKEAASDEEGENIAGPEGKMRNMGVITICDREDGGEGLTRKEDLEEVC
jgi:hypothetical protein